MCIRCGGIFNNHFIANFPENLSEKKFVNRLRFDKITAKSSVFLFFSGHSVYTTVELTGQNNSHITYQFLSNRFSISNMTR